MAKVIDLPTPVFSEWEARYERYLFVDSKICRMIINAAVQMESKFLIYPTPLSNKA